MTHRAQTPRLQINARLVKEKDRARARELRRLLLCGAAIVVPLLVYVWQRVEFLRVSYEVESLKKERQLLQETSRQLGVERSFLLSPDRIERVARREIGLVEPSPTDVRRVAIIDGRIDEVGARAGTAGAKDAATEPDVAPRTPARADIRRPSRPRPKPPRPGNAGTAQTTAVEAGVGLLPLPGAAAPARQDPDQAP